MLDGEVFLLEAVRDTLRTKLDLNEHQCQCEYDELIPAIAGHLYVAVIPGGIAPGPTHQSSSGVIDAIHSVQVTVLRRTTTARDRYSATFFEQLHGINRFLTDAIAAIDWQIDVLTRANHKLWQYDTAAEPFIEMLRVSNIDARAALVNANTVGGSSAGQAGSTACVAVKRSVLFTGCRRIQHVNQNH